MAGYVVSVSIDVDTTQESGMATYFEDGDNAMRAFRLLCASRGAEMDVQDDGWKFPPRPGVWRSFQCPKQKFIISIQRKD